MNLLDQVASRSTCVRRRVGCIFIDAESHILATGYNGVPKYSEHCIEIPCAGANQAAGDTSRCLAIHAEQNAILQCRDIDRVSTIYVSCTPCFVCTKMLLNLIGLGGVGLQRIVCGSIYADYEALTLLAPWGMLELYESGKSVQYLRNKKHADGIEWVVGAR